MVKLKISQFKSAVYRPWQGGRYILNGLPSAGPVLDEIKASFRGTAQRHLEGYPSAVSAGDDLIDGWAPPRAQSI
jgi:hypothetical protein